MQSIILSVACMGFVVSIDAMMNPETPKYAPEPLPYYHFDNIKPGCIISIKVANNRFEERGFIYHMSPEAWTNWGYAGAPMSTGVESAHLNVYDVGMPGHHRDANNFFGARVDSFPNPKKKKNRVNQVTLECGNWVYPVELHTTAVSYEKLPSRVRVRARAQGEDYTMLTGTLSLAPQWVDVPRPFQ